MAGDHQRIYPASRSAAEGEQRPPFAVSPATGVPGHEPACGQKEGPLMSAAALTGHDQQDCSETAADVRLAIADGLTAHDLDVLDPAAEGSQYLKVTNARGALCEIMISEHGSATWEYHPFGGEPGPAQVTAMVLELLGAGNGEHLDASSKQRPGLTLTGIVGKALTERGMRVRLAEAGRDEDLSEMYAEIVVINPARPDRGTAQASDDGMIRWECRFTDPARSTRGIDPAAIAGTIARALSAAMGRTTGRAGGVHR